MFHFPINFVETHDDSGDEILYRYEWPNCGKNIIGCDSLPCRVTNKEKFQGLLNGETKKKTKEPTNQKTDDGTNEPTNEWTNSAPFYFFQFLMLLFKIFGGDVG